MQKLDMSSYGVEELDVNEMRNLDGGILLVLPIMIDAVIDLGVAIVGALFNIII